jgi:hypothetical protein
MPELLIETNATTFEIPPLEETEIPINITNLGNGKTTVTSEITEASAELNASITSESDFDIDELKQIMLTVEPDENFTEEEITLEFTPHYMTNSSLKGQTYTLTLVLKNDGSLEEEDNGFQIPGFEILAFIAAIVICLIILKRRKK